MSSHKLTPAEREFEAALGALRPAAATQRRDELMFHAGRAAARREVLIWRGATGVLLLLLMVMPLSARLLRHRSTPTLEPGASPPLWVTRAVVEPIDPSSYLAHRAALLSGGAQAGTHPAGESGPHRAGPVQREPATYQELLRTL